MNKEEAKKEFSKWFGPDSFPDFDLVVQEVDYLIDSIEPEHKKVVLPKTVGEQWDKLVYSEKDNDFATKVDNALYDLSHNFFIDSLGAQLLFNWCRDTPGAYSMLIDASKYGWVPKLEKLYRVKVYGIDLPGLFYRKRDDGTLSFVQGGAGQPETEFTLDEIKHRHLENCEREEVVGN